LQIGAPEQFAAAGPAQYRPLPLPAPELPILESARTIENLFPNNGLRKRWQSPPACLHLTLKSLK
jgi:hypothetical protein